MAQASKPSFWEVGVVVVGLYMKMNHLIMSLGQDLWCMITSLLNLDREFCACIQHK